MSGLEYCGHCPPPPPLPYSHAKYGPHVSFHFLGKWGYLGSRSQENFQRKPGNLCCFLIANGNQYPRWGGGGGGGGGYQLVHGEQVYVPPDSMGVGGGGGCRDCEYNLPTHIFWSPLLATLADLCADGPEVSEGGKNVKRWGRGSTYLEKADPHLRTRVFPFRIRIFLQTYNKKDGVCVWLFLHNKIVTNWNIQ